jgi:hypothetical protein
MIQLPPLPTYRAQWRAVYFETIPGSGERFTFAILVRGSDGRSDIRDTLRPGTMRAMLGSKGEVLHGMMVRAIVAIKQHLDKGGNWLESPLLLSNMVIGPIRDTLAENFEQVFDQAIRLSASLGESSIGAEQDQPLNLDAEIQAWASRIRSFVEAMQVNLKGNFDLRIKDAQQLGNKARIGFMHSHYAASFAVLHSRSERISADISSIKKKLWDLDQLRHNRLDAPQQLEIIVGHTPFELISSNQKMFQTLSNKLEILRAEAANKNIDVFPTSDVKEAADHILRKVASG